MKLTRKLSLNEFSTLEQIKRSIKRFVAKDLAKKGKPVDITQQIGVNTTQSLESVLFKTKTKL